MGKSQIQAVKRNKSKSRKHSMALSSVNSLNTSIVPETASKNHSHLNNVHNSLQKVQITDEFIKKSIKERKTKLRDKLERKLGLSQFKYAKNYSKNHYSASAKKKRRTHSLINKQIENALGSNHKRKLKENWAEEWVQKAQRLNFDDIKLDRTPAQKNSKTETKRRTFIQKNKTTNP
jgi:hypothetical protein